MFWEEGVPKVPQTPGRTIELLLIPPIHVHSFGAVVCAQVERDVQADTSTQPSRKPDKRR
jgi:hypothetical protein